MKKEEKVDISHFNPKKVNILLFFYCVSLVTILCLTVFKITKPELNIILVPVIIITAISSLILTMHEMIIFNNLNGFGYNKEFDDKIILTGPKITIDKNGKITMPYQRIKTELTENEKNFGLEKVLYLDYSDVSEKTHISLYEDKIKDPYIVDQIKNFTGQKASTISQNIKELKLNKKEMKELIENLYKIKEINYKNYVANLQIEPIVYQEKNIYNQISSELQKTKEKLLKK